MHRRRVLALAASSVLLAGCSGSQSVLQRRDPPSTGELLTAERPPAEPPRNATDETAPPLDYPAKPASYTEQSAASFVEQYERAYRRNTLLERRGGELVSHDSDFAFTTPLAVSSEACVVRTQYRYTTIEKEAGSEQRTAGHSPWMLVTCYVDDSLVVRAERDGDRDEKNVLRPDPWKTGTILEPAE
ncbi:hypothetical protein [Halobacterium zhouii]|uniref:hypothetical protein n=1 Tax=Halobacterium zhouii TaxID=2902624 RepID=UPI001E54614A|nr:hypothetical protein [Halobacterium zhouii]